MKSNLYRLYFLITFSLCLYGIVSIYNQTNREIENENMRNKDSKTNKITYAQRTFS